MTDQLTRSTPCLSALCINHGPQGKREACIGQASVGKFRSKLRGCFFISFLQLQLRTRLLGEPEKDPLKLCAFEEETRPQLDKTLPPTQLDLEQFELENDSCNHRVQLEKP